MNLGKVRTLIIDDNIMKASAVARALQGAGGRLIETVTDQESGLEAIRKGQEEQKPFGLIVTDMQYPLTKGGPENSEAGYRLFGRLEEEQLDIPVIVCSAGKYSVPKALGSVWYSDKRDLKMDLKEILERATF